MKTVIVQDENYLNAMRIKRMIDWGKMDYRIILDIGSTANIDYLKYYAPSIIIFHNSKGVLSGLIDMNKYLACALHANPNLQVVLLSDDQEWTHADISTLFPEKCTYYYTNNASLDSRILEKLIQKCSRVQYHSLETDSDNIKSISDHDQLKQQLNKISSQKLLYLFCANFKDSKTMINENSLDQVLKTVLKSDIIYYFWIDKHNLCIFFTGSRFFSALYALISIEDIVNNLINQLQSIATLQLPFLISQQTTPERASEEYKHLKQLIPYRYFCSDIPIISQNWLKQKINPLETDFIQKTFQDILNALGKHDRLLLTHTLETFYKKDLKESLDLTARGYFREKLLKMLDSLTSMFHIDKISLCFENINTIEEELQHVSHILSTLDETLSSQTINSTVLHVLLIIHQNYDKPVTQQSIADELNITPSYLSRLFKLHFGVGFSSYLSSYRINMAKEQIERGETNVSLIAQKTGFNDARYFSRVFKNLTGITPTEYINRKNLPTFNDTTLFDK